MNDVINAIKSSDNILILCHIGPDGDTLGSAGALAIALSSLKKRAVIGVDGEIPTKYLFLLNYYAFLGPGDIKDNGYDCIIAVDSANPGRLGVFKERYLAHPNTINIDHHPTGFNYGKYNILRARPSAGEIILDIIKNLDVKITKPIAECLYTAMVTDTGRFSYAGTDQKTFYTVIELMDAGADISSICNHIYASRSLQASKLLERALRSITVHFNGKLALMKIMLTDYENTGARSSDCEDFIDYAREIDTVEIAVFLRQVKGEEFKVSLRSKKYADVLNLASCYGGGGHVRAAGFTMYGNIDNIVAEILEKAEEYL